MRKCIYIVTVCVVSLAVMLAFRPGIFRLHVIANSDSAEDQAAKLAVRDAILSYERDMWSVSSAGETKARLMADGAGLCAAIDGALREQGMDYSAELHIGRYDFPDREYAGVVYPAGEYEALRVILGDGNGKNWWCVMFPPLCILEAPDGEIEKEAKFDSLILKLIREVKSGEDQP
ncbi:MAG: stage II sporulation protein R [Clostridia bacterium]|nr:stage II sporulation protein R [Clostridia bacterium]